MRLPATAVVFDVGGVLFTPDPSLVAAALFRLGLDVGAEEAFRAHYAGMARLDADLLGRRDGGGSALRTSYLAGMATELAGPEAAPAVVDAAASSLQVLARGPASSVWTHPVPGARAALQALSQAGVPLAVVSNSDGTVEAKLAASATCQVGPGPGVEVAAVVDSACLGASKPDPAIFAPALDALGLPPSRVAYVGDSVHYDVAGAERAGMVPVHFDPFGRCRRAGHRHLRRMDRLVSLVAGG
ncbi:MAG TPA: HAD family hydrolase [Acidimicrobiales bacterium]|nr:HAD family hydrolase [Acidimicrobiales bacterium]